jgi:tetratricopeptide (TPR) repeat protein
MILYSLGRLDEALDQFLQNVSDYPDACECRFYVGALIDYALGEPEQAQVDIETAQDDLLSGRGVRAYVLGRLALDAGDKQQAIKWFQEAEAQLTRDYGPTLLSQIKEQLSQLGASPLSPTQSVSLTATPQP